MKPKTKDRKQSKFGDYGVTLKQVERACAKVSAEINREGRAGKLKPWRS
jgi:hypothetical protein